MNTCELISVIVPVYNAAEYLDDCITSIISQTYSDFECILINDGSTDESLAICNKYAQLDSRIIVINKQNGGVSSSRNAGLDASKGQWIIFADADDYYLKNAFSTLIHTANQKSDIDIVASSCLRYENGKFYSVCTYGNELSSHPIKHVKNLALWGNMFRKDVIESYGIRFCEDLRYSEDKLFMFDFLFHSRKLATTADITYVYRIIPSSACHNKDTLGVCLQQFEAVNKMMSLLPDAPDTNSAELVRRHCDLIVSNAVGLVFQDYLTLNRIKILKRELDANCCIKLKKRLPFWAFCIAARIKRIKRKYFPKKRTPVANPT